MFFFATVKFRYPNDGSSFRFRKAEILESIFCRFRGGVYLMDIKRTTDDYSHLPNSCAYNYCPYTDYLATLVYNIVDRPIWAFFGWGPKSILLELRGNRINISTDFENDQMSNGKNHNLRTVHYQLEPKCWRNPIL